MTEINLFATTEINERPPVPETIKDRLPTLEQQVRERYGFPVGWEVVAWTKKGELAPRSGEYKYLEISGGIYRQTYQRGKRKGEKNFQKPEPGSTATVNLTYQEIREWVKRWEVETGFCSDCHGTGFSWSGWSAERGIRYKKCKPCGATGKAP